MGNLLRKGRDFDETFSCCISWDGIRWCASVACALGKEIKGLDAITSFLQAREQFDLYAYLPSHGSYSSLSYEELAVLRGKLMDLVEKEGMNGLRKFAAAHKRESRVNPKECYRLNSSIYGAPSANHEWDMLFQNAHVNGCGMTISEVEPSLYVRIETEEKFENHFPDGIKTRLNPLSIADEKTMLTCEITDEEAEEGKHLPYRELLGVVSLGASCTKLEMLYAVSVCGKHIGKWGVKQFEILKKMFEYGFTTRHTGLIYSKGLDEHGINVMSCFADSGHSLPRSYGSTTCMMNGAATSSSAKKHSLTASGTYHDKLIEFSIAANKVVGYRNMMEEMHLSQDKPTVIYQDNEAAIMIAMNRGSMSNQSRHVERRILTCRNKIEDDQIIPVYIETGKMIADIGTKAFSDKQFAYLRDQLTGYSLVKLHYPTYALPSYVV
jgi:hypothetical protein